MTHRHSVCLLCRVVKNSFSQSKPKSRCKCGRVFYAFCIYCKRLATQKNKGKPVHKPGCIVLLRRYGANRKQETCHRRVRSKQAARRNVQQPHTLGQSYVNNDLPYDIWNVLSSKQDDEILSEIVSSITI